MPHFIIDCSENILRQRSPDELMQAVYDSAEASGLFSKDDTKVRLNTFGYYNVGNTKNDFIHIFGYVMEGRNAIQKSTLSKNILSEVRKLFPHVPVLSINVTDFERESYCNKAMI